jgi:hypothetical protein
LDSALVWITGAPESGSAAGAPAGAVNGALTCLASHSL